MAERFNAPGLKTGKGQPFVSSNLTAAANLFLHLLDPHPSWPSCVMEIEFERNALYEEVWTVPLTQLGKKYGLSDNGIRKICKAMSIPLPKAGHWAKIAAGKHIPRIPLPPKAEKTSFTSRPRPETPYRLPDDDEWLEERVAFERRIENKIQFDPSPRKWHSAVAPLRQQVVTEAKELPRCKRDADREDKSRTPSWGLDSHGYKWRSFLHNGQLLCHTHKTSPLRVSLLTYERALAILNALCFQAEARGFTVTLSETAGRFVFDGFEGMAELRITEQLNDEWRKEQSSWEKKPRDVKYRVPSGKLRLYVGETYSELCVADAPEQPIENDLNAVLIKIYSRIIRARERQRERDAWRRQCEEEDRKRQIAEQARRDAAAAKERERKKREALVEEANAWRTATLIRDYLTYLQHHRHDDPLKERHDHEWHSWAKRVADDIDPTTPK